MMWKRIAAALLACLLLAAPALAEANQSAGQAQPTETPENAPRVVDLTGSGDVLKVMGYDVVGTTNTRANDYAAVPSYLQGLLGSAQVLGNTWATDFDIDAIAALEPELILIAPQHSLLEPDLKKIAETKTVNLQLRNWKMDMLSLGELLNHRVEVATWLDSYSAKALTLGQSIRKRLKDNTMCLALMISAGQLYAFVDAGLGGILYNDLGMSRPTGMSDRMGVNMTTIGFDQLERLEIDFLFLIGEEADRNELKLQAEWRNLPVVKKKHVIELATDPYLGMGYSCVGADMLLNEIDTMLAAFS